MTDEPFITPEVGMGVTLLVGSDRHAGTICYVSPSKQHIRFTLDVAHMTPSSHAGGPSGKQIYLYSFEEEGTQHKAYFSKDVYKRWICNRKLGQGHAEAKLTVIINTRDHFRDPSF